MLHSKAGQLLLVLVMTFSLASCKTENIIKGVLVTAMVVAVASMIHEFNSTDKENIQQALEEVETGAELTWQGDEGPHSVTPTSNTFKNQDGRVCRKYQVRIIVDGDYETGEGTACRKDDGTWELTS
jgi:surface antigen